MLPRFHPLIRLLFAAIGACVALVAATTVVFTALLVAATVSHRAPTSLDAFVAQNPLAVTIFCYPVILLWLWFCRRILDRQSFASLGLRVRGAFRPLMSGALCAILVLGLLFGLFLICGFAHVNGFSAEWRNAGARGIGILAFYLLAFCCVGVTEEIVFRGYAFHNLSAWLGVRAAIWTQAILFGLAHLENVLVKINASGAPVGTIPFDQWPHAFWDARWGITNIALIGVFFALSYLKTGSLWFAIGFHMAWNFVSGCILSLPVSGVRTFRVLDVSIGANSSANGGTFGVEGSVFLVAIIAVMLLMMRREKDNAQTVNDLAKLNPAISETAARETLSPDNSDEAVEDDPTHVSRFHTSMRPLSTRPALELGRSGIDISKPQSGFAPNINAQFANAPTETTPFANVINATVTIENEPATNAIIVDETIANTPFPAHETASESVDFAPSQVASNAVVFAPPTLQTAIETSSTRNAETIASAPQTPIEPIVQDTRVAEPEKLAGDSVLIVTETQSQPTPTSDEKPAPAKPKKATPKW